MHTEVFLRRRSAEVRPSPFVSGEGGKLIIIIIHFRCSDF